MIICFLIIKALYIISHNYVYILITSIIHLSSYIVINTQLHKKRDIFEYLLEREFYIQQIINQ